MLQQLDVLEQDRVGMEPQEFSVVVQEAARLHR
jgi:hypothetical protein